MNSLRSYKITEKYKKRFEDPAEEVYVVWYRGGSQEFEPDKLQELRDYLVEEIKK